jgi:DNA processing protein
LDWNRSSREDAESWLRLVLVPGVAPSAVLALLREKGSPAAAAASLARGPDPALLDATLRWLEHGDHHLVAWGDACYPPLLLEIANPPPVLYVAGRIERLASPAFAIVGSRNATTQGARDAETFARALSRAGLAIVSGLALGIDAAAHRGGLADAGSSIGVMGTGPDVYYPAANRALAAALARDGCLVSEFPLGTPARPGNFPRRNRLISGMSKGVLVVEAAPASGSLTTARRALEQNRDVFAIPGSIHSPLSKGCHWLIKEGAKLVETADDVLRELGFEASAEAPAPRLARQRDPVLDAFGFDAASLDQIVERTGMDASRVAARICLLELDGRLVPLAGGRFQRVRPA